MDCRKEELAEVLHSNCALQHQQRLQQANLDALQVQQGLGIHCPGTHWEGS